DTDARLEQLRVEIPVPPVVQVGEGVEPEARVQREVRAQFPLVLREIAGDGALVVDPARRDGLEELERREALVRDAEDELVLAAGKEPLEPELHRLIIPAELERVLSRELRNVPCHRRVRLIAESIRVLDVAGVEILVAVEGIDEADRVEI